MDQIQDRLLVLVPSSGNPDGARDLLRKLRSLTVGRTDLVFYIDGEVEGYPGTTPYITGPAVPYGKAINALWEKYPWYRLYMLGSDAMVLNTLSERKVFAIFDLMDDCAVVADGTDGPPILSNRMIDVMGRALPGFSYTVCSKWIHRLGRELDRLFYVTRDVLNASQRPDAVGFEGGPAESFKSDLWDENESNRLITRIRREFGLPGERDVSRSRRLLRSTPVAREPVD